MVGSIPKYLYPVSNTETEVRREVWVGGVDGGWGSTRVGEYISIVSSIATDACCYAARPMLSRFRLVASEFSLLSSVRLLSLARSLAGSIPLYFPSSPSLLRRLLSLRETLFALFTT